VSYRFSAFSGNTSLKPELEQTEKITGLGDLNQFVNETGGSDSHRDTLDEVLVSSKIKELSNNLGSLGRIYLGNIYLNVLQDTVQVKVVGKLINTSESVANMNERTGIGKLGVLEVVLDLLRYEILESRHTRSASLNCSCCQEAWMYLK